MKNFIYSNILFFILGIAIVLLIITRIQGCQSERKLANQIFQIVQQKKNDSLQSQKNKEQYNITIGQIKEKQKKDSADRSSIRDSLNKANKHIDDLLAKYKPITVDNDTGTTICPNQFIIDCSDCFNTLPYYQGLAKRYIIKSDSLATDSKTKDSVNEKRIAELEQEKNQETIRLSDCLSLKTPEEKPQYSGILFGNLSTVGINNFIPTGLGGGLTYQDDRFRQIGANIHFSNRGNIYTIHVSSPLIKFKKRRR